MKWKILVSWPGTDGLARDSKKNKHKAGSPRWNTKPQRIVYWMMNVMRRIHPSPQHGAQYGSCQLPLQENHPHATSQRKVSLFQQLPNTQLVRQLNARQPITMRNDQGFHPLLHLRVSNCPIFRFPFFQLIPENVLKVKVAESFCITWWSKSSVIVARLLFSNV